jgi:hypothetical protein
VDLELHLASRPRADNGIGMRPTYHSSR